MPPQEKPEEYPGETGIEAARLVAINAGLRYLGAPEISALNPNERPKKLTRDQIRLVEMATTMIDTFIETAATHPSSAPIQFRQLQPPLYGSE